MGGVQTSKSEPWSGRGRRTVDCGLRKEPEREPVQDLESDVVGQLLSAAGADGEDTESKRRGKEAGHTDRVGSDRADGGGVETGAGGGPPGLFRFPRATPRGVGAGCRWGGSARSPDP